MEIRYSEKDVVRLEGELNIQEAGRLREMLLQALGEVRELSLDLGGVTEADIACLQVLCSAHRSFLAANRGLKTAGVPGAPFIRAVDDSGYRRTVGCHSDPARGCLWVIGGGRG